METKNIILSCFFLSYSIEASANERGELWCKGPNIMKGYIKNPEATADCLDAEGYFHTGDVAIVDEKGNFSIVDRIKELIKYKGFQVRHEKKKKKKTSAR